MALAIAKSTGPAAANADPKFDAIELMEDQSSRSEQEDGLIPTSSGDGREQVRDQRNAMSVCFMNRFMRPLTD